MWLLVSALFGLCEDRSIFRRRHFVDTEYWYGHYIHSVSLPLNVLRGTLVLLHIRRLPASAHTPNFVSSIVTVGIYLYHCLSGQHETQTQKEFHVFICYLDKLLFYRLLYFFAKYFFLKRRRFRFVICSNPSPGLKQNYNWTFSFFCLCFFEELTKNDFRFGAQLPFHLFRLIHFFNYFPSFSYPLSIDSIQFMCLMTKSWTRRGTRLNVMEVCLHSN